jgi:hypothetical protein
MAGEVTEREMGGIFEQVHAFPDERVLTIGESTSNGSPCASRQNQDFRSGEPPRADQSATRPRLNCIRGRSLLRPAPGFS